MSELYLSRLLLDPRRQATRRALADCQLLHQYVLSGFPSTSSPNPRDEFGVLYRPEVDDRTGLPTLLVQSRVRPDWSTLSSADILADSTAPSVKEIAMAYTALGPHTRLRFRLRANPTRRVNRSHAGTDPLAGKRVDLRDEEAQRAWLHRKGEQGGFVVIGVQLRPGDALGGKQHGRRRQEDGNRRLTFVAVTFDGVMEVRDPERLRATLWHGVGSAKAYGFGLLSVAPARE